jgi:hypothetical protein
MGVLLIVAIVLGVLGFLGLFVFPWVGGPMLLIALVLGAIALFVVGPATVVAAQDEDVDVETDGSPHLPGPGNPESGVS